MERKLEGEERRGLAKVASSPARGGGFVDKEAEVKFCKGER